MWIENHREVIMRRIEARLLFLALGLCAMLASVGHAQSDPADSLNTLNGYVRAAPNPWSASPNSPVFGPRQASSVANEVSGYSRIAFHFIPAVCTIRIYTVDGDIVATVDHELNADGTASHSAEWYLVSDSDQYVVSGIYVYVVRTPDGQAEAGKLIIIR